jgi:hypothetical protein
MTYKGRIVLLIALGMVAASCMKEAKRTATYYNIDSLISSQVDYLAATHATVRKVVHVGEKKDTSELVPADTSAWKKELDIFRELDAINKPLYRDVYTFTDGTPDTRSNLLIRTYAGDNSLPVEFLKVYYHRDPARVRKIEGRYAQNNSLYSSSRLFTLEFMESNGQSILTSYTVQGGPRMFMGDSVQYAVTGLVTLPD